MDPVVFPESFDALSDAELTALRDAAVAEGSALSTAETFSTEDADRLDVLATGVDAIDAELAKRKEADEALAARRAAQAAKFTKADDVVVDAPVDEPVIDAPVVATTAVTPAKPASRTIVVPAAAQIVAAAPAPVIPGSDAGSVLVAAAADVPGIPTGSRLENLDALIPAIIARWDSYPKHMPENTPRIRHGLATFKLPFPEDLQATGADDTAVLRHAIDESRLRGGSLVAAGGWCAPSEQLYNVCSAGDATGLFSLPEIGAPRGGIRFTRALDYQTIFAQIQALTLCATETQLMADPPLEKDCIEVDCPTFVEVRMDACWLCIKTALLQNRAYPEYVREFIRTALVAHTNLMDTRTINAVVTLLGAATVIPASFAAIAPLMSAIDLAAVDFRYKHSMPINATLEVVLPEWLPAALRADFIRRNAADADELTRAMLNAWFAERNVAVQWVRNWQATGFGQVAPATGWPTTVQFMLYEAGSFVRLREDIIRVDTLSDATLLTTNRQLGLFVEEGWAVTQMCKAGRLYTVTICPNGQTGGQQAAVGSSTCPIA